VIVVGSLILIGVSMVASIAYAWGCAREMTKLVSCEEVPYLHRWEMKYAPSGVESSAGGALRSSDVLIVSEERKEFAISMPCVSAWRRYPCAMVGLCGDMEGRGRDVVDCTKTDERHHGAQCASALRSERRRGGRIRYLAGVDGVSGWVRYMAHSMDCSRMGL